MAILEAVACGLTVVSTKVGGIPEVLPEKYIQFVEPEVGSIELGLVEAVNRVLERKQPSRRECHEFVRKAYDWRNVTQRTLKVYAAVKSQKKKELPRRVRNLWESGTWAGPLMAVLYLFCHYWICLIKFWS